MTSHWADGITAPREDRPPLKYHTLEDLANRPELTAPPVPLVAPVLYRGRVTLLAGREKIGKSTLAGALIAAVSAGRALLEATPTPEPVLVYSLDEPLGDTTRRLTALGADPRRVTVCTERPTPAEVAARLAEHPAALVAFDTLNELLPGADLKDAAQILPTLRGLVSVLRDHGAAGLILAHAGKTTGTYLGAVQLGGVVDAPLVLRDYRTAADTLGTPPADDDDTGPADDGRRILEGRTRWGGKLRLRLVSDGLTYRLGDAPAPLPTRVLRTLYEAIEPLTLDALTRALGVRAADVRDAVKTLKGQGAVRHDPRQPLELTPVGVRMMQDPTPVPSRPASRPEGDFPSVLGTGHLPMPDVAGRDRTLTGRERDGSHALPSQNAGPIPAERDGTADALLVDPFEGAA
ncbi:MAG: AAA family ATPase [Gemmatimonadota bacterium]|jgi:hypothetical protein|nr:AAA family ATPase [Gemmatimonadota bacterium]